MMEGINAKNVRKRNHDFDQGLTELRFNGTQLSRMKCSIFFMYLTFAAMQHVYGTIINA